MTDIEFWLVLAETIKGAGCLPMYMDSAFAECGGLCPTIRTAEGLGLIDHDQCDRLLKQLEHERPAGAIGWCLWWPLGHVKARIAACRRIAAKLMKEAA